MTAPKLASIRAAMGASGTGKSAYIKGLLRAERPVRLMVWDFMREYSRERIARPTESLASLVAACRQQQFRVAFHPSFDDKTRAKQFDLFCRLAMDEGDLCMLVEEMSQVTKPSFAPAAWSRVTLMGRHHGLRVIGASQRPAHIDKNFLGNATTIRTGGLRYPEDRAAVAKAMGIDPAEIAALVPLQWIERDMGTGAITRGGMFGVAPPAGPGRTAGDGGEVRTAGKGGAAAPPEPAGVARKRPARAIRTDVQKAPSAD